MDLTAMANKNCAICHHNQNVTGHGIDNHLCALEVLCRELGRDFEGNVPKLFREPMWTQMIRFPLSTSQVSLFENSIIYTASLNHIVREMHFIIFHPPGEHISRLPTQLLSLLWPGSPGWIWMRLQHSSRQHNVSKWEHIFAYQPFTAKSVFCLNSFYY